MRDVAVIGNIGSGKTSFVNKFLRSNPHWRGYFELGNPNPCLGPMFNDPTRWTFSSQVSFLGHAFKVGLTCKSGGVNTIRDWSTGVFFEVYCKFYHQLGWIDSKEMSVLSDLYNIFRCSTKDPSKFIYLSVDTNELRRRSVIRGRPGEGILRANLEELDNHFQRHVADLEACGVKVIHVDANALDLRTQRDYRIAERLVKS
jgi:deoxyadenosine/deoxycytidine kinase